MREITQTELKSILHYDPDTGDFHWSNPSANRMKAGDVAGTVNRFGYRRIHIKEGVYLAHRLAWLYIHGVFPSDQIDHINGIKGDNRIANLRVVTTQENQRNAKMRVDNKSGVVGVCWHKGNKQWKVQIGVGGERIDLGCFSDKDEAIAVRKQAEKEHGFHANHGRTTTPLASKGENT